MTSRVEKIRQNAFTADAHFDLTYDLALRKERKQIQVIKNNYLTAFQRGGFDLIVSSIFINNIFLPEMGLRRALDQISYLMQELQENTEELVLCRTFQDVLQAKKNNQIGIMLAFEGVEPLQNDINLLPIFHELGVRGVGLTWSRRNYVGDGAHYSQQREGQKGGLSAFGVQVIEKAEKMGMYIDVSHMNDKCFWDTMKFAQKPVLASHSNCRALCDVKRNLTDPQIEALAKTGGLINVCAISEFIGDTSPGSRRLNADDLINHIDHIVKIAGIHHIGLGLDFCDGLPDYLTLSASDYTYDVIEGHQALDDLISGLIKRNYSDEEILLILGGNFKRYLSETLA